VFRRILSSVRNQWMGALALFLVLTGGAAFAGLDPVGPDGDIDACYDKRGANRGEVRLLLKGRCNNGTEKRIEWSQQGPQGPQGPPGPPGPSGADGADGANGADGTARAYAYVQSQAQRPCSPACTFDHAKGIAGVTHPALGTYCVNAPGINSASESAVVTVENGGTSGLEGNTSAMIEASGFDCPAGQFEVITERQPSTAVRNAADTGSINVAGNATPADDPSFTIVIP